MKWFQLDSDMPEDPKIRAVARALGAAGVGGLVATWCFVAKHGFLPGQGVDRHGAPLPIEDVVAASLLPEDQFTVLMDVCTRTGHIRRDAWEKRRGIWIPAMERRADGYARKLVRSQRLPFDWTDA